MPLYYFKCEKCGIDVSRIFKASKAAETHTCECGGVLTRDPKPATSRVTEVLDNGIMSRKIERLADAERIYHEHAIKGGRKDG